MIDTGSVVPSEISDEIDLGTNQSASQSVCDDER